jgi:hypothetical protein
VTELVANAASYPVKRCERSSDQIQMDVTELVVTFCSRVTASKETKTGEELLSVFPVLTTFIRRQSACNNGTNRSSDAEVCGYS